MRKFATAAMALLLILFSIPGISQTTTVNGIVKSDDNTPVASASIVLKGRGIGTKTDASGAFSITAGKGEVLSISAVGFVTAQVRVTGSNLSITLRTSEGVMQEVVVTAMDIKRNPRELGYSVQKVTGKEIAETQRENFLNGLQGRVAGLTINQTNGQAGASSSIVLRGFNSMALDNQPLFVVDGIIADNQTINETSNQGVALGLASDRPNRNNDYTNRIADLNPNDIESITVLKGPEATALYGSQASSGAIVITTKKGSNTGKLGVNYDNSFRMQRETRFPNVSNRYSAGSNGTASNLFSYFGPEYAPGTQQFDNVHNFFKTGFAQTHNLSLDFGKKNVTFRASGSIFDQSGVIPDNKYRKLNFRISNTTKIGKYLDFTPSISYINSKNDKPLRGAGGYLLNLLIWPVDNDVRNYLDSSGGKKGVYSAVTPNAEFDNPFFNVKYNKSRDITNRYLMTLGVNINPFSWLTIAGRFGYDTYKQNGYTFYHPESFYLTKGMGGQLDNYYRSYKGYNHTINVTATKKFADFSTRLMAGTMWQDYRTEQYSVTGTNIVDSINSLGQMVQNGIIIPNNMNLGTDSSVTRASTRTRLNNARKGLPNYVVSRQLAFFAEAQLGYKNLAFLTYSHRFETSSIFPTQSRSYNYPAASLSVIVSDIFPTISKGFLNYLKLRGSLASTARSSLPYQNQSVFGQITVSGGGYAYGFTNSNPNLEPEIQKTKEIGIETKMFRNRIALEVTYYNTLCEKQIAENFRASYATGFVLNTLNVGSTRNQGVEISLNAAPIQKPNFTWNVRLNFNKMYNKVLSLPDNVPEFYISDTWAYQNARGGLIKGGPSTAITSFGYARNNNGDKLIDPVSGLPVLDQTFKVHGDRNPDFTLGTLNTFRYKNLSLSFLWDLKVGGDIINQTDMYLTTVGKSLRTDDRKTSRIIDGVLKDGLENTATPTRNNILITPYYLQSYYSTARLPDEEFIEHNVNWFALRDITLSYMFPAQVIKKSRFIKGLSVFATGNDLILLTNYTGADPMTNTNTAGTRGVGGWGFDYGNIGTPISVNLGLRAAF